VRLKYQTLALGKGLSHGRLLPIIDTCIRSARTNSAHRDPVFRACPF